MTLIQSIILGNTKVIESRGQKEFYHTALAKLHLKNKCWRESSPTLHWGHWTTLSKQGKIEVNHSLVGIVFQAIFQTKSLSLSLRFSFKISFQKEADIGGGGIALLLFWIARYAELDVNRPVLEKVQINLVFGSKGIQMLKISWIEVTSNTELRANKFHCFVRRIIKSDISVDERLRLWVNFGDGLKEGRVGIQAVVQIGRLEFTETSRQAPERSKVLLFCIPFYNHEVEAEFGDEKKLPYLMYFFWSCWTETYIIVEDFPFQFLNES
jgi:hypothetical protein